MPIYDSYKDSKASWLGQIPSEWETGVIGSLYKLRNTKVSDTDYPPLSVTMKGIVPQLENAAKTDAHDARKLVLKGDFAINSRSDRRGSCGISEYDGSVSLINTVLTPRKSMNPKYYDWLFHTVQFADEYYKHGHGIVNDLWTTKWDEMKRIIIPVPSDDEQISIAEYLDKKIKHIDSIISETKSSIEEYKTWKASIIYEAVTKGLDPNVEMKDSGVEWIGNIPKNWSVKRVKFVTEQQTNKTTKNVNYIGLENVESFTGNLVCNKDEIFLPEGNNIQIQPGNILFGKLRPYLAKCIIANDYGCCSSEFIILKAKYIKTEYIKYVMLSPKFVDMINMSTYGAKMPRASSDFIRNMIIPIPPTNEQIVICKYIEKYNSHVDLLIAEKKQLISDLEAYKKSLIFEVVTGKRKVV